jgi:hypothetical protein
MFKAELTDKFISWYEFNNNLTSVVTVWMSLFQLAAGFSLSGIVGEAKGAFEKVVDDAQDALQSLQEQSESSLNQITQEVNSQLDEILPQIEEEVSGHFSNVAEAIPKIRECLEAQKEKISAIVENASKYTQYKPIDCCQYASRLTCLALRVQFGYTEELRECCSDP